MRKMISLFLALVLVDVGPFQLKSALRKRFAL